jgi:hypothetical protein
VNTPAGGEAVAEARLVGLGGAGERVVLGGDRVVGDQGQARADAGLRGEVVDEGGERVGVGLAVIAAA